MKAWKLWAGLGLLLLGASAALPAEGLYVLGGIGGKSVLDQDMSDYYGVNNWGYADEVGLFDAAVSVGWRFPGFIAVEGSVAEDGARGATATGLNAPYDQSDFQIQPMTTFALGPVFCWDHPSWWWRAGVQETAELGLKLEYAGISGSETLGGGGVGSQDFSDSALGLGIFIRDLSIWNPGGFSLGLEAGWDSNYFGDLTVSNGSGAFAGANGQQLQQYGGGNAYIDNSGGYVRLVVGWTQHPQRPQPVLPPRRWRRRYYNGYYDGGYEDGGGVGQPGDGAPGDTVPSQPQAQPTPQAAPASPQSYPDSQNYGN